MSRLRARCPNCRTLTAVALGDTYECHACGSSFEAGLVRVPRAWGADGEEMAEAAFLPLPYPEVAVVDEETLEEQTLALAAALPDRPVVIGGCCCAHTGAVEGLAAQYERLAVVWLDAHGDLNTPETSPTGNVHGMPLAAALGLTDGRFASEMWTLPAVEPSRVALVGLRSLDTRERERIRELGIRAYTMSDIDRIGIERAIRESLTQIAGPGFVHVSLVTSAR
ncbi:MAG TPA: arginase family protein [Gaiellaceae bacterium]|nr:arginase family protein [Gaiellaceae bacterium]